MVKVDVIKDTPSRRILRCQEGNRIWYQLWINPYLMGFIERYFEEYIKEGVIKAWYMKGLYYVFFYEKKGGKVRGVLGKDKANSLLEMLK